MKILTITLTLVGLLTIAFFIWDDTLFSDQKNENTDTLDVPFGLPPIPWPEDNPYSKEKANLGQLLYFDKRISSDSTISCASCHGIQRAFSDEKPLAVGILGQVETRHSPTIINAAYQTSYFWDGRASTLEEQSKGPIGNPMEMTLENNVHEAHLQCHERIRKIKGYRILFKEIFNSDICSIDEIADVIATFERTVLSGNSPYDRYKAGDDSAMSEEEIRGMQIFNESGCADCHSGPNFTDGSFKNIGVGMDKPDPDLGRYGITNKDSDWGAFKTPTLREVEHSYPYMHDGSLATLEEVIDFYDRGGIANKGLSPLVRPLFLTEDDKGALISFLKALSGEGWQHYKAPEKFPE